MKDILNNNIITVYHETSLREVIKIFYEKNLTSLVIVNEDNEVLGMVKFSDLFKPVFADYFNNFILENLNKVTFTLPDYFEESFEQASVVGEFNNWNAEANVLEKNKKTGLHSADIELEAGREYRFRYVVDGKTWLNDPEADRFEPTPFGDSENCIFIL